VAGGVDRDRGNSSLLTIPPFPGAKVRAFERIGRPIDRGDALDALTLMRELRVGGTFWAARPEVPAQSVLIRSGEGASRRIAGLDVSQRMAWPDFECDPWHMLSSAKALVCDVQDEVRPLAAILGIPTYATGQDGKAQLHGVIGNEELASAAFGQGGITNPFNSEEMSLVDAVKLLGFWRSLIDSNRPIAAGVGFAFWKRSSIAPLLWGGGDPERFFGGRDEDAARPVAIWRSKASSAELALLEKRGTPVIEVEDGFLRSRGLGADCIPPLSITVDRLGAHFDPGQPSELEELLENQEFDEATLDRARRLRTIIVAAGLGKYERGASRLVRPGGARRHILVPGQVEDDRSVLTGGAGMTNLELLRMVREREPDAYILYKPHPDVAAGHRRGRISANICLKFADNIVAEAPISSLIAMVDEVHVNTSLAGFEALMREVNVTTYGVPFYAGWGLTRDLGPVPARRTRKRSLDELVAATLIAYPRYLDPVTGLPCPAEVVVDRLAAPDTEDRRSGLLVWLRRLQGRSNRIWSSWRI
jgi:capsular polysaccharide export protein